MKTPLILAPTCMNTFICQLLLIITCQIDGTPNVIAIRIGFYRVLKITQKKEPKAKTTASATGE